MAFTYPPIDTTEKLQRFIDGDPKLTEGRSPFYQSPDSEKYTKFLGNSGSSAYKLISIFGPRIVLNSLEGIRFPDRIAAALGGGELKHLQIVNANINRLDNAVFPNLLELFIKGNHINSLIGVRFPESLRYLTIENEPLQTLEGVRFPSNLADLHISGSRITSIKGIIFPSKLISLNLSNNQIASFDGMKFPPLLTHLDLGNNPLTDNIQTVNLLERPTEVVRRSIIRDYPETAQYFEARRKIKDVTMQTLQNHVRSIAQFLQPLIDERKEKEEEKNLGHRQVLFVNMPSGEVQYTIPFIPALPIQSAIDYLEQNYLLSVINGWDNIEIIYSGAPLNPERRFADYNIESEATLNVVARKLSQHGGRKKTKYNRLKIKKCKSRRKYCSY